MRERMAQTFRLGNASYLYYYVQNSDPTKEDYEEWLTRLPDNISNIIEYSYFQTNNVY